MRKGIAGLSYVLGLSRNARLQEEVRALEASTAARYARNSGHKVRRFKTFSYAAGSWSKPRRVVARVEVGSRGRDPNGILCELIDRSMCVSLPLARCAACLRGRAVRRAPRYLTKKGHDMVMETYIGLDVSLASTAICTVSAQGKIVKETTAVSEPEDLIATLKAMPGDVVAVGLEAGPLSQWLYRHLYLDNDGAGFVTTRKLFESAQTSSKLADMRSYYEGYDDLNAWLLGQKL